MEQARAAALASMAETPVDLLIIGGGITGAGIARDAALRGFRTALIDKVKPGKETDIVVLRKGDKVTLKVKWSE